MSQTTIKSNSPQVKRVTKPQVWRGPLLGLKRLMKQHNMDDNALGESVGRTSRTVQSWRVGEKLPASQMLGTLAGTFGVEVGDLFRE